MIYRHGDLSIRPINAVPDGAKHLAKDKSVALALGETTGHSHTLTSTTDVELFELEGDKYFVLGEEANLTHQEHNTITIAPAIYKVIVEREFDYFSEELRRVRD